MRFTADTGGRFAAATTIRHVHLAHLGRDVDYGSRRATERRTLWPNPSFGQLNANLRGTTIRPPYVQFIAAWCLSWRGVCPQHGDSRWMNAPEQSSMKRMPRLIVFVMFEVVHRAQHHDDDGLTSWSRNMPKKAPPPPPLTVADIERKISDALAEYHEAERMRPITREVVAAAIHEIRKQVRAEFAAEIEKVKSEFDLRLSALLQATEKLERGLGGDRAAEIVDLLPVLRGVRHA
jgi:hypothetical protein